jgi:GDPmannose 4,6-dehydratase
VLRPGKLTDAVFIQDLVRSYSPTHVYYLAAHHHSAQDTDLSQDSRLWQSSVDVQVLGLVQMLEALRLHAAGARLFYAASSHIFGSPVESPQNEQTPRLPDNIYGVTKVAGIEACRYYQRRYGQFAMVGILYNHESVHRKEKFLSQKIIRGAIEIKNGQSRRLVLGDLSAGVDWGYAPDYVDAMMRLLDLPHPGEYVVATGECHTVREFVRLAFQRLDLDDEAWVVEDPAIIRKQGNRLMGDSRKLRLATGWSPSVSFQEMVGLLTDQTQQLLFNK